MPPPGSGPLKGKRKRCCFGSDNYGELFKSKRSVLRITNDDELCCPRAIVVAKAIADEDERLKVIKNSRSHLQENLARALHEEARVSIGPCGLDQIKLFEIIWTNINSSSYLQNMDTLSFTKDRKATNKLNY